MPYQQKVIGSSPIISATVFRNIAQLGEHLRVFAVYDFLWVAN